MNIIIDTHILVWSILESHKLKKSEIELLLDQRNNIFVSIVSLWEISLKYSIGKLKLTNIKPDEIPDLTKKIGFMLLNLRVEEATEFYKMENEKVLDPFDKMLMFQAIKNDFKFFTKDNEIKKHPPESLKILEL